MADKLYTVKQRSGRVVATNLTEEDKERLQVLPSYRNLRWMEQPQPAKPAAEKLPKGVEPAPDKGTKPSKDNGGTSEDGPPNRAGSGRAKDKTSK